MCQLLILSLGMWDEEDNIAIGSDITCVIYTDIQRTRFENKNETGMDSETVSELSSDAREDVEVAESDVVDFINDYKND